MTLLLRAVRALTAAAIVVALVVQFTSFDDIGVRYTVNFFSYFTVLSNLATVVLYGALAARPGLEAQPRTGFVRGAVTLYMCVTGIVYAVLLAPAAADVGLTKPWVDSVVHVIAPLIVFLDWVVDPPATRLPLATCAWWLAFPAVYFTYSLVRGPIVDWYPYPFLDPRDGGYGKVIGASVGVLAVFVAISLILRWWAGRAAPSLA